MCSVTYRSSPTTAPRLRTTLASLSIRTKLHYAVQLAAGYPLYGLKIQPPPFTRPSALASHLNTRGDHLLVSRHPTHDNTQPRFALLSTNMSNGHRSATTRLPYKLRWRETARKWKSHQYSALFARVSLFRIEWIRNSMSNRQSC